MDLVIRGGRLVDGTGKRPFIADIGIERDRIAAVGKLDGVQARKVIDAKGLTVTPGFIDGHTHSELSLMKNRQYPGGVYQGISTIVTGQCGLGFAPIKEEQFAESIRMNSGIFGDYRHYFRNWTRFGEFLSLLGGSAVNAAANVSHNAIRQFALGFQNAPLKGKALDTAKQALREAMEEGAVGLSVGLSYYPGGYSDTEELIELCRVVKEHDGLFCVHLRLDDGQIPHSPTEEIARVVRETGVRLNMLHYRTGGMEDYRKLFQPFQRLTEEGADIHYEYYPYLAGAGLVLAFLPGWAQEGGYEAIMERISSKELRDKLLKDMRNRRQYFLAPEQTANIILTKDPYSPYLGKSFEEISKETGESFEETVLRLLQENDLEIGFAGIESQSEELKEKLYDDQYRLFLDDQYGIGSDTIPAGILCHPRAFGSFARIIANMRERKVPVETIVKKLTFLPASLYHLKDRGCIREGMKADICLMDYEKVRDTARFENPRRQPEGILSLYVNGLPVMEQRQITGILPGESLKRGY